ncbi:MAG: OmpH family outer membrane protein [Burkholderiaceae bacterium]
MRSTLVGLGLATLLGLGGTAALAQGTTKIGYVNTERILRDAAPAKAAQKKLEAEFATRDRELQSLASELKSMGETLERDRAVLSESDRVKRQRAFADLEKDFQRKQREFREDVAQRRNEELAQVLDRANRSIRQIADAERFDLIVQEAVFASPRIDITESVLKALAK